MGMFMSVEYYRESPGKFDPRTLNRDTLRRWTGRTPVLPERHLDGAPRVDAAGAAACGIITIVVIMIAIMIVVAVIVLIIRIIITIVCEPDS